MPIDGSTLIVAFIAYGILCGAFASNLATEKGFKSESWFVGGFVAGIIAVIAAAGLPDRKKTEVPEPAKEVKEEGGQTK